MKREVTIDPESCAMLDKLDADFQAMMRTSHEQLRAGLGIPHEEVVARHQGKQTPADS